MRQLNNAMDIFKVLQKSNCGACKVPTCLAFAAAVFKGDKSLLDCPHLTESETAEFEINNLNSRTLDREEEKYLDELRSQLADVDFAASVERLDATLTGDSLTIKSLGKDFSVDPKGNIVSDCHIHGWVTVPLLNYVVSCAGKPLSGNWVPFRELRDGASWAGLFEQRCEKPLKRVADTHTDLFEHMIQIFSAKRAPNAFDSDIAVVLRPLPRIPLMICYWKPEDDLESSLHMFFDDTAADNLIMDSVYRLTAGLVIMFEKIAITHGR